MAKIKRVITAQQREHVRQKELDKQKERLGNKAKLTQNDINELVRMLAKEHGLI